jgi:uncharacterized protein YukE
VPAGTLTPIAGDPFVVGESARTLATIAAHVAETSSKLRALAGTSWTGDAADRASTRTATLPPKLDKVVASYSSAGAALRGYASSLADAQTRSSSALRAAASAQAELAQLRVQQAAAPPDASTQYDAAIASASARLSGAVASNETAHSDQQRAASIAARQLHEASALGIKNQPWWRHVLSSAARFASSTWTTSLRVVARVATSVSALAGLAALALSIAGLLFPPLEGAAAVLETISLVSGVLATGADAALAASGRGSWTSVGVDALALAPWAGSNLVSKLPSTLRGAGVFRPTTRVHASRGMPRSSAISKLRTSDSWGAPRKLNSHVKRHGADFGITSADDYAEAASAFLQRGLCDGLPTKISERDGAIRIYDSQTNTFGSYNADGTTRTYYKPNPAEHGFPNNEAYWRRQEGRVIG